MSARISPSPAGSWSGSKRRAQTLCPAWASPAPGVGLGTALLHSQVAGHRIEMRGVYLGAHEQA
jgi:hypothetical protein